MDIRKVLTTQHSGDLKQLEVVFSDAKRVIVEAPAGCGKTTTMVSRVAYLISQRAIPINKKILALTFSVNAAYKMKKDVYEKLPGLGIEESSGPQNLNKLLTITNYHGLARRILGNYGYLLHNTLSQIDNLDSVDDSEWSLEKVLHEKHIMLTPEEKLRVISFSKSVKNHDDASIDRNLEEYNQIIINKFVPCGCLSFNSYLTLAIELFNENSSLLAFYQKLFPVIIIDEFQDTNVLSWKLVQQLINNDSRLLFMGDSLQRIYGFIGAIPNLMENACDMFGMKRIELDKNYRFASNNNMLYLDKNIRENARNPLSPSVACTANVNMHIADTQENEVAWIVSDIQAEHKRTAILVQQSSNNYNLEMLLNALDEGNIPFFYALFSDEDEQYIEFHKTAERIFNETVDASQSHRISSGLLNLVCKKIEKEYKNENSKLIDALIQLTKAFFRRVVNDYRFLENDEKIAYVRDAFESRSLKQNMDAIDADLFVSTVHGAKGLEWDKVVIPDMEQLLFPNYPSLCMDCFKNKTNNQGNGKCKIIVNRFEPINKFLEELSVFYVAVTRTRGDLVFTASIKRYKDKDTQKQAFLSCLLSLPGLAIKRI